VISASFRHSGHRFSPVRRLSARPSRVKGEKPGIRRNHHTSCPAEQQKTSEVSQTSEVLN
jgi:hypothetical protein